MIDRYRSALLVAAAAYLALLPSGALSFWRSATFAAAAVFTLTVVARQRASTSRLPLPGRAIPLVVLAWAAWTLASTLWSVDAGYSLSEWRSDVLSGLATMAIFYVATVAHPQGFERLAEVALCAFAFWTALAIGYALSATGWDTRPFHRGDGAFATYLVTVAPLLLLLAWPAPVGLKSGARSTAAALLLLVLLVATTRLSESRIAWVALAAIVAIAVIGAPSALRARKLVGAVVLLGAFALLFADAAHDRATHVYGHDASVAATLEADPRLAIWQHTAARIRERPWLGHGYGLHILGSELGADTGDASIRHPHNLFLGQWLQTGAIGAALFIAMLALVARRFLRYVRSDDVALARLGSLGLAVLVAYAVRNLTDDFFLRANGKLLFATTAMLLGAAVLREREIRPGR